MPTAINSSNLADWTRKGAPLLTDRRDVPYELRSTAGDWYDGGDSAMYNFWMDKPYDPVRLLKETRAARAVCGIEKWLSRLAELEEFAAGEVRRVKARAKLEAAVTECFRSGAESWQVQAAYEEAFREASARAEAEARQPPEGPGGTR